MANLPRIVGAILILLGLIVVIFQGFPYDREQSSLKVGPVQAQIETSRHIHIPRVLGLVTVAAGVLLIFVPAVRRQ